VRALWPFLLLLGLAACDAGPSAVLPDGAGAAPSSQAQPEKAPAWAQKPDQAVSASTGPVEQASMPIPGEASYARADAPHLGEPLPLPKGPRADISETRYGDWPLWSKNRKYSADENAHYHFERHGPEFSAKSYPDYMAMVHGFIHNPPPGTQTLKRSNGDTLFYDPKGNVFAVMTKAGAPRTVFRPDNGAAYWQKQKQIESERRTPRRDSFGTAD
jgi:hypothetical protein